MKKLFCRKSSYVESNLKKLKNMELEFHVKFLILLNFYQIEFFIETQFSKSQVSK